MKANLKGLSGFKGLLLMHGEKLGIALVGLLALWFVYSSLSLPRLKPQYQAANLQQEISQTSTTVEQTEWPAAGKPEAEYVRFAKEIVKTADPLVPADPYMTSGAGFAPIIPPTQRRTDPELLNAVAVRAIGGSGLFAFIDEETRKKQEQARLIAEEERAKQAEKLAKEQQQQAEQGRTPRRGREGPGEVATLFDPEHPNRRMVQNMSRPAGVPLQGGERIERAYWATIVAKVPIREQLKLYQDAFETARGYDPSADFPVYKGYMVQRAEVVRGKPLEWKLVPVYDPQRQSVESNKSLGPVVSEETLGKLYETMQKDWAGQPMEPVAPQFIDPILAMPLPPLVGRDWGSDATHPDIPLAINAPPPVEELEPLAEQAVEQPVGDPDDPASFFRRDPNQPALSQRPGFPGAGMSRFPGAERAPFRRGFGGEFGTRGPGGPGMPYGEGGYSREFATGPGGPRTGLPRGVDHMLLRFFDFSVEPGKKYKYRVRLVLVDPNHGLQDSALDPAVQDRLRASKKKDFRMVEEWSEPSPTVGIPLAGAVMLAEAKPANEKNFNDEPAIKLMVETFDVQDGTAVHVAKEKDFRRGAVVNLKEKMEYTGDGDRWIDTFDSYEIRTGVTVLDVTGGDRLSKDMSTPARMLVMHPSGEISIRKELDDSTSVAYLRALFAEDKQRAGEGYMPYGPEMMPFRGGGRER